MKTHTSLSAMKTVLSNANPQVVELGKTSAADLVDTYMAHHWAYALVQALTDLGVGAVSTDCTHTVDPVNALVMFNPHPLGSEDTSPRPTARASSNFLRVDGVPATFESSPLYVRGVARLMYERATDGSRLEHDRELLRYVSYQLKMLGLEISMEDRAFLLSEAEPVLKFCVAGVPFDRDLARFFTYGFVVLGSSSDEDQEDCGPPPVVGPSFWTMSCRVTRKDNLKVRFRQCSADDFVPDAIGGVAEDAGGLNSLVLRSLAGVLWNVALDAETDEVENPSRG